MKYLLILPSYVLIYIMSMALTIYKMKLANYSKSYTVQCTYKYNFIYKEKYNGNN